MEFDKFLREKGLSGLKKKLEKLGVKTYEDLFYLEMDAIDKLTPNYIEGKKLKKFIENNSSKESKVDHNKEFFCAASPTESEQPSPQRTFDDPLPPKVMPVPKPRVKKFKLNGTEGRRVFNILSNISGETSDTALEKSIIEKDHLLIDQIAYTLRKNHPEDFERVKMYFSKFKETKDFLDFEKELSPEIKEKIRKSTQNDIPMLSNQYKIAESIINEYFMQYELSPQERLYYSKQQVHMLLKLARSVNNLEGIDINEYKKIYTHSYQWYLDIVKKYTKDKDVSFSQLYEKSIPIVFYCIKCNLPLDDIMDRIILVDKIWVPKTGQELFHLVFQKCDPLTKALCIEDLSFNFPVPFLYPSLSSIDEKAYAPIFGICKELWFNFPKCLAIVSFGLGSAGSFPVGKSYLLDQIFGTDFADANCEENAFHFQSIDVQFTKNFPNIDSKFSFFDCHSCAPLWAIQTLCKYSNIIIIHVLEKDFIHNKDVFMKELENFYDNSNLIVVLIRDCIENELENDLENIPEVIYFHKLHKTFTRHEIINLKTFFKQYLNPKDLHPKDEDEDAEKKSEKADFPQVDQSLILNFLRDVADDGYHDILDSKLKIDKLIETIELFKNEDEYGTEWQDFLSYYPIFVNYMRSYHKANQETDLDEVDRLNAQCENFYNMLHETKMSPIVSVFLDLMDSKYSSLLLMKLSKYLTELNENFSIEHFEGAKYKYSIDIIWREALLSFKYCYNKEEFTKYNAKLDKCYSKQILEGEPFELIDGDNLVFYSKDLDVLLQNYYQKQTEFNFRNDMGKKLKLNAVPTVVSIFGPQSSGKSTLLNYCFGCKFVTSAARCTKGVYGSLFQMKDIVNNSKILLILDTEGFESLERDDVENDAAINFDQTLALFCLSVSQIVIINIKEDIGTKIKNLLRVCAYSLNRLKVNKVDLPKIFIVLNQQADPDVRKHAKCLNLLLESLETVFYTADLEPVKASDLIKITSDNLFILPSAFNSQCIDDSPLNNTRSRTIKLNTAKQFALECSVLRTKIFDAITDKDWAEVPPFKNVSEWIQMAGLIWDTCIKYQDIVCYSDLEELAFSEIINKHSLHLIDSNIYQNELKFQNTLKLILKEIDETENCCDTSILLTQKMEIFDEVFSSCKEECEKQFVAHFENHPQSRRFNVVFEQAKSNFYRLIFIFRKRFEDRIKFRISNVVIELKITDSIIKFRNMIEYRIDDYINFSPDEKSREFERIWEECYGDTPEDDVVVRNEHFGIIYANFKIECNFIEKRKLLHQLFKSHKFNMEEVINDTEGQIKFRLKNSDDNNAENCFFCVLNQTYGSITLMEPYNTEKELQYLHPDSLIESYEQKIIIFRMETKLQGWIPKECRPFVNSCIGHYNNYEIVWGRWPEKLQILHLSSKLKNPTTLKGSCWDILINKIRKNAKERLKLDPQLSQTTIKILINDLTKCIRVVNHEIKYIRTMLSNRAERELSTLVFAYSFQEYWNYQMDQRKVDKTEREKKKGDLAQYFYQTIANRKMIKGDWDTNNMKENDLKISTKFAIDYIDSIKRYVITETETKIKNALENLKEKLTVKHLLIKVNGWIDEAIDGDPNLEITDIGHLVIRFICNRNTLIEEVFHKDWNEIQRNLMLEVERDEKQCFEEFVKQLIEQFQMLLNHLDSIPEDLKEKNCFYSDYNFELPDSVSLGSVKARETPFKAMGIYLSHYLDPHVTNAQLKRFLKVFIVSGVKTVESSKSILPKERVGARLNPENFKRLTSTNVFRSELIFNIFSFISNFRDVLLAQLSTYSHDLNNVKLFFAKQRRYYLKDALGCTMQCPSCGKFCEREIHNDGSKCQITTGHQLSSMGGKVWQNNPAKTAILFMCDDYQDHMSVKMPGKSMKWSEFKLKCGKEWKWGMPNDPNCKKIQTRNRERMRRLWTKFGKGILRYYKQHGTTISFIPYDENYMKYFFEDFFICFIIDGTGSMGRDIEKARLSVSNIVKHHQRKNKNCYFRIIIYRDHCDEKIIETYPSNFDFSDSSEEVIEYLSKVKTFGGGDGPEAILDGLATGVTKTKWSIKLDRKNLIVHIFDAPPHGDFPNYKRHSSDSDKGNCCCCNHATLCPFDWVSDVWNPMKELNIQYCGINTSRSYQGYEDTMKNQLGDLCAEFQVCGKEQVATAVMEVFINFDK